MVLTGLVVAGAMLLACPARADKAEAEKRFEKGVFLFKNDDFEGALVEFRAAYEAEPHFAVLYNVSICLFRMHDYPASVKEMKAYLEEGGDGIPLEKRDEIEGYLRELEDLVGMLEIDCAPEGAKVHVDGEHAATCPVQEPVYLSVGEHEIEVTAPMYVSRTEGLELPGGSAKRIEMTLDPGKRLLWQARKKVPPPVFWTLAGLTLASAVAASVSGGLALKAEEEYAGLDYYDENWKDVQSRARGLALGANVMWGVTGALGVAMLVVAFLTRFREPVVSLEVSSEHVGLVLGGRF